MLERDKVEFNSFPVEAELKNRKQFSEREVGLTHPDLNSFIRLTDQGDIELFAAPGIGIVISGRSKSISLFGDSIRIMCKEDGLRWNKFNFNYASSAFMEPTLVEINYKEIHSAQNGAAYYLDTLKMIEKEEKNNPITIMAENNYSTDQKIMSQDIISDDDISDLSYENRGLLEAYASSYNREHMLLIVKYLRTGSSFDEAHRKAEEDLSE
jgi:hypothetical protein